MIPSLFASTAVSPAALSDLGENIQIITSGMTVKELFAVASIVIMAVVALVSFVMWLNKQQRTSIEDRVQSIHKLTVQRMEHYELSVDELKLVLKI